MEKGKQKRNSRKGKDKLKDENSALIAQDRQLHEELSAEMKGLVESETVADKDDIMDYVSDVSESAECAVDMLQPDSEDREASPANWDTDTSEIHPTAEASGSEISSISTVQNGVTDRRNSSIMDDSSSTCSTDSAPSTVVNGAYRSKSFTNYKNQKSPSRLLSGLYFFRANNIQVLTVVYDFVEGNTSKLGGRGHLRIIVLHMRQILGHLNLPILLVALLLNLMSLWMLSLCCRT